MITETGAGLSVLIVTEPDKDWQTFGTWYSFYKNLPDAKVAMICFRNGLAPFAFYQWTKRLEIKALHRNPYNTESSLMNELVAVKTLKDRGWLGNAILVVKPLTMAIDVLDPKTLDRLNESSLFTDNKVTFFKDQKFSNLMDDYYMKDWRLDAGEESICFDAKEHMELACLVTYRKGCGKWIDTAKGCPFSSAAGLVAAEMTANESRIIELWKKMVSLYDAVV